MAHFGVSAATLLAAMCMSSIAYAEPSWSRFDDFDHNLSFELPCSSDELDVREHGGPEFGGSNREVWCQKDGLVFRVGVTEFSEHTVDNPLYDDFAERLFGELDEGAEPVALVIPGHRTVADRGQLDGLVGQRALIEVSPTKVAILMVGGDPDAPPSMEAQQLVIRRFFQNVKVRV